MRRARVHAFCLIALLLLALAIPAIATAQPTPEMKSLVGKWKGTGTSPGGNNDLEWTIQENGTVGVVVGTPGGPRVGAARLGIKDGKFFYDSASSSGVVTVEGAGDDRVLKYEAVFKRDGSRGGAELRLAK